jgi:hypothetical protein
MGSWVLLAALLAQANPAEREKAGLELFEKRIRPLLIERCYECHSAASGKKLKGDLLLDTKAGILKGGSSGPPVVPGDPGRSLLVRSVRWADEDNRMPPKKKLDPDDVAAFERWVALGAPDPREAPVVERPKLDLAKAREFWSFRPLTDPKSPAVRDAAWPASPIDRFTLAALEARGLSPVADAGRRALLRRATFDLTGLPPTPEEVEAFVADASPDAWSKAVDRLLASPAYGERWGRHWLDLVRYSDTAGDNSDYPVPQLRLYRDWVIAAFNADKPFPEFVREQLAGDLLPWKTWEERRDKIVATGYVANAKRYGSRTEDYPWHLTYEDTIDNLGRTFLGLSLTCARCHDHKFDPVTMEDYYGLYGIFGSTKYSWPGIELDKQQRDLVPLVPPDQAEPLLKEREAKDKALEAEVKRLEKEKKQAETALKQAEKPSEGETEEARKERHAALKLAATAAAKAHEKAKKERDDLGRAPLPFPTAYAVFESKPGNAKIQMKGQPEKPGPEVPRRFLAVLGGQRLPETETGSGRRQLADWIVDPSNPLTARVLVNRIWLHHFGRGLVPTPSDFGKQGKPPTHPELLDWLASRFLETGGSIKTMHRLILNSRTYRLSTSLHPANAAADPGNEFLWRANRRRLDAESIRDAVLSVSGRLDRAPIGEHPFPDPRKWDFTQHKPFKDVYDHEKRSVYLMTQRFAKHPFLGIFDGADPNISVAWRGSSTTTLQALYFLNDPFFHAQAKAFADRVAKEAGADPAARVARAYALAFGRPPDDAERAAALGFLQSGDWGSYARSLLRLSEFVYVD